MSSYDRKEDTEGFDNNGGRYVDPATSDSDSGETTEEKAMDSVNEELKRWDNTIAHVFKSAEAQGLAEKSSLERMKKQHKRLQDWAKSTALFAYPETTSGEKMTSEYPFSKLHHNEQLKVVRVLVEIEETSSSTRRLLKGLPVYTDAADPELSELLDQLEAAIDKLEEYVKPAEGPGAQTRNADSSTKDLDKQTVERNATRSIVKQGAIIGHGVWKTWPWKIGRMFIRS